MYQYLPLVAQAAFGPQKPALTPQQNPNPAVNPLALLAVKALSPGTSYPDTVPMPDMRHTLGLGAKNYQWLYETMAGQAARETAAKQAAIENEQRQRQQDAALQMEFGQMALQGAQHKAMMEHYNRADALDKLQEEAAERHRQWEREKPQFMQSGQYVNPDGTTTVVPLTDWEQQKLTAYVGQMGAAASASAANATVAQKRAALLDEQSKAIKEGRVPPKDAVQWARVHNARADALIRRATNESGMAIAVKEVNQDKYNSALPKYKQLLKQYIDEDIAAGRLPKDFSIQNAQPPDDTVDLDLTAVKPGH